MLDQTPIVGKPAEFIALRTHTVGQMIAARCTKSGPRPCFRQKVDGRWVSVSWADFYERCAAVGTYLLKHGIEPDDKVCMVGSTRPEWSYGDVGGHFAGAVTLGAYPTLTSKQLAYVLDHADTRFAFVEGKSEVEKILEQKTNLPSLELVGVWETDGLEALIAEHEWLVPFSEVLATRPDHGALEARMQQVDPSSVAIIVYTSGTTGPPKGAMITHDNIMTVLRSADFMVVTEDSVTFSFLPMAHVAERILGFYGRINVGMEAAYASSISAVLEEVAEVEPTVFGSVPRIFEKAYGKIMSTVEQAPPARQRIFRWAERTGRAVVDRWQSGESIPVGLRFRYRLADRLVFSKLRAVFGGRVQYFVTGAAPVPREILDFFWAAGFPIYEVYGMTESTVVTHANRPGHTKLGSVGKVLPFVEDRIAEDGEILIRGKTVFAGYYKNPEATANTVDSEGWLHTGDIGKKDDDGYVYVVDRKKHIIITAGGKNLTPANIENEIKTADSLISQVHAHGDKRKYLVAIVTVGPGEAVEWAKQNGLVSSQEAERHLADLAANPLARSAELQDLLRKVSNEPALRSRLVDAVNKANETLSRVETIKKIYVLDREFSIDEDELTPTLKMKRKNIETKFKDTFDRLYDEASFGEVVLPA